MSRKPTLAVFILRTHYPSGRTPANILKLVWLCVSSIKTDIRRTIRPDELPFIVRRSRRITNDSSSRRIMRLVPVFMLVTHNQMNFKCLPKFVQTNNPTVVQKRSFIKDFLGLCEKKKTIITVEILLKEHLSDVSTNKADR